MTEKQKENEWDLVEVPTQHVIAIRSPKGETLSVEQAVVEILNQLEEIKKQIG